MLYCVTITYFEKHLGGGCAIGNFREHFIMHMYFIVMYSLETLTLTMLILTYNYFIKVVNAL